MGKCGCKIKRLRTHLFNSKQELKTEPEICFLSPKVQPGFAALGSLPHVCLTFWRCKLEWLSEFLNRERPGFYVDENRRVWMVSSLFFTPGLFPLQPTLLRLGTSTIIVLWQINSIMGFPPIPLNLTGLPMMWRKESLMFYRGSDNNVWKLEQHFQIDSLEQLVLKLDGYVGAGSEAPQLTYPSSPDES
ncbi:protein TCL1B2-like [Chionomys nivalis]|uniref:protein TCL1B2-like n=1 Tax=Chionomys nivalis TaxID=269649 RepID=UPI002596A435|nr:protein TCL1B2-like [Chionomys nivalis]